MTVSPSKPTGKPPIDVRRQAQPPARDAHVDVLLDRWVARLAQPAAQPPSRKVTPARVRPDSGSFDVESVRAASVRESWSRVTVEGSTVRFADEVGGEVVLARLGRRIVHRGTVATRGPFGLTIQSLQESGLSENHARAMEFVAAWFGAPFDSVSAARSGRVATVTWGLWPLSWSEIPHALAAWKSRAPERFESMLGAYGLDVVTRDDLRGPAMVLIDSRGAILRGDRALELVASDARRLAVLARAGRDEHARASQVERVIKGIVQPVLRIPVRRGESCASIAETVVSARGLATLLCAARELAAEAFDEVVRVAMGDAAADSREEALLDAVARYLRVSGHAAAAHDVRRTLSSPELRP